MAQARTIKFGDTSLLLGNGASPEVYTAPCGFTELTLTVNIELNAVNVPDCDDPDLPAWLYSDEVSKQMVLSGTGVLDKDAVQDWEAWLLAGGEKNCRWERDLLAADSGGYFQAPALLSSYSNKGSRGQRFTLEVGLTLNGKPEWTAAV